MISDVQGLIAREAVECKTPWTSVSISWRKIVAQVGQGRAHARIQAQHPGPEGR